jgi:hypothetical protein
MGMMDYDAIAVGEMDLAFGRPFLEEMAEKYDLPLISANVVDHKTKEPIFDPYVVREVDGVRVGFVGVISPERHIIAQVETKLDSKLEIGDPTEYTSKVLPEVREQADLVVLLSHTGIETSEFLAEDLDVDVLVVGHYPAIQAQPKEIGGTLVAMAGSKSDRFGILDLTLGPEGGEILRHEGDAIRLMAKGPEVAEITLMAQEADRREKEERRQKQLAAQREREAARQQEKTAKVQDRGGVFGAESCKACHEPVYESWMETPHATAFATLAEADAWDNPDCIGCHVTGIDDKHFVDDVNVAPEVWNVQCEECHGSGLQHARDGSYVTIGEELCRKCHDSENSPDFDFETYYEYGVH